MATYYSIQIGLYPIIYIILVILTPSKPMNWILKIIFLWEGSELTNNEIQTNQAMTINQDAQKKEKRKKHSDFGICEDIWKWFGDLFQNICSVCCSNSICHQLCLKFLQYCCTRCNWRHNNTQNKEFPCGQLVQLDKKSHQSYSSLASFYMKRMMIYTL